MLDEQIDLDGALRYLRAAAQIDSRNPEVYQKLAWALLLGSYYDEAAITSAHVFELNPAYSDASIALVICLRAISYRLEKGLNSGYVHEALDVLESTFDMLRPTWPELMEGEVCDRLLHLSLMASELESILNEDDAFKSTMARRFGEDLRSRLSSVDANLVNRKLAPIHHIVDEKYYGFIRLDAGGDYFFHLRDLCEQTHWRYLHSGSRVAFLPNPAHPRGRRAEKVRFID